MGKQITHMDITEFLRFEFARKLIYGFGGNIGIRIAQRVVNSGYDRKSSRGICENR